MNSEQLISSIAEFATLKNIDKATVITMLREVLNHLILKKFGTVDNFDIIINYNKGDLQIWRYRMVVTDEQIASGEVSEVNNISLSNAQKIEQDFNIGEEVAEEINLAIFGRRAIVQALQLFLRKNDVIKKDQLYEQYKGLVGKIILAEVGAIYSKYAILYDGDRNRLMLPKEEQIGGNAFKRRSELLPKGAYIKALVQEVKRLQNKVEIILSRSSPLFVKELLSAEIPEIADEIVVIKGVGRISGFTSKVAVSSYDDRVDPVGACIGPGGRRIRSISQEHLDNERIEVIPYMEDKSKYLRRIMGLSQNPLIQETEEGIIVWINPEEIKVASDSQHFASQLLETPIHIRIDAEEDVLLDEFANEIDSKVIELLKGAGLDTAKNVLKTTKSNLVIKTGLGEEIIGNLYKTLAREFE